MNKLFATLALLLVFPFTAFAAPTHSLDLESGSSQQASITDASQTGLDLSTTGTIQAWIRIEDLPGANSSRVIVSKDADSDRGYQFSIRNTGGSYFLRSVISSDGTTAEVDDVAWTPTTATHYFVMWTYNGTAGEIKFYVNCLQIGTTQTATASSLHNTDANFRVGAFNTTAEQFFDGLIKDVRVFSDVRSQAECIADAYTENVSDANLQGEWNFNNAYTDSSGNGNTLTATNSPVFSTTVPWTDEKEMTLFSENFNASNQSVNGYNSWATSGTSAGTFAIVSNKATHTSGTNFSGDKKQMSDIPPLPIVANFVTDYGKGGGGEDRWEHYFMIGANGGATYTSNPTSSERGAWVFFGNTGSGEVRIYDGATLIDTQTGIGYTEYDVGLSILPDGSGIVTLDNVVKLEWAARTWSSLGSYQYNIISMDVNAAQTANDGTEAYFDEINVYYGLEAAAASGGFGDFYIFD